MGRTRREALTAVVLKATVMANEVPLSRIWRAGRPGIVMLMAASKSCVKPKRSRMMRTEYRTWSHLGNSSTFGTS